MTCASARVVRLVLLAGVAGATCDIVYAILYYGWRGIPAERILQTVASGLLVHMVGVGLSISLITWRAHSPA
jgi:hypothetical protein